MKKTLLYFIIITLIIIFVKYRYTNYNISYKVKGYDIKTVYKKKRLYYEIKKGDKIYNFDIYKRRNLSLKLINNIKIIKEDNLECIYPSIKDENTYPLCYLDNEFVDYNLIESSLLDEYKKEKVDAKKSNKDFVYYNNLNKDEYIALWNYKGYIVMNDKSYKIIDLFKKDKYDNTLAYLIDNKIYMANYDEEHEYSKLITFDLKNNKKDVITLDKKIDFDSYIVGHIKRNLYIYDNKNSILYEVDLKNGTTVIKGNNELGFIKYKDGKMVACSKSEYKNDKIKYNIESSKYTYAYDNGLYKSIKDNSLIKQKILDKQVAIIKEYKNKIYYLDEDDFYYYNPLEGKMHVFYNYELSFNNNNAIFVYINN